MAFPFCRIAGQFNPVNSRTLTLYLWTKWLIYRFHQFQKYIVKVCFIKTFQFFNVFIFIERKKWKKDPKKRSLQHVCFRIVFGSLSDRFPIVFGSFSDHFRIVFGSFSDHFRIVFGSLSDRFQMIIIGSFFSYIFCQGQNLA